MQRHPVWTTAASRNTNGYERTKLQEALFEKMGQMRDGESKLPGDIFEDDLGDGKVDRRVQFQVAALSNGKDHAPDGFSVVERMVNMVRCGLKQKEKQQNRSACAQMTMRS